jgi:hypothetical protein
MVIFSASSFAMGERPPEIPIIKDIIPSAEPPKVGGDTTPPGEVSDLKIERVMDEGKKIRLSWKNPPDEDFEGVVIIVRADRYPEHAKDSEENGKLLIDLMGEPGGEQSYTHSLYCPPWMRVVTRDPDQYYLIVTYDRAENYSRGVRGIVVGMVI